VKKLPLGIQNIKEIITDDYIYADKTQYIYNLINNGKYYFLSRPRRFGKSLLLDVIKEVFSANKELFKGLWIYNSDYDFTKYPVLRLDMSNISNKTSDILEDSLIEVLKKRVEEEELSIKSETPSGMFKFLIEGLFKKHNQRVVVLIDEYDKPILDHLDNIEEAETNRKVLRGFYGILKSMDPYLKFALLTGVSKFAKTSVFSELNNLLDITLTEEYANICGIATEDLPKYFGEHVESLSKLKNFSHIENIYNEILHWYDGYSWNGETRVINPFSLLSFFKQKRFSSFWYASGSPKFLMDLIKKNPRAYTNLKKLKMSEYMFDSADIERLSIESLLFQSGYLTIKEVLPTTGSPEYLLDLPNFEVREAFNMHVLTALSESSDVNAGQARREIYTALSSGDLQKMLDVLKGLFASIPYQLHIDLEAYYHSIFFAVMSVLGFDMDVEVSVSKGRVDAILEINNKVYIMEFKYKDCAPEASSEYKEKLFKMALTEGINQIKDRDYAGKFAGSGKTIYQAAFAFLGRDDIKMQAEEIFKR